MRFPLRLRVLGTAAAAAIVLPLTSAIAPAAAAADTEWYRAAAVLSDGFARVVDESWGTAPLGGEYDEGNAAGLFSVGDGHASTGAVAPGRAVGATVPVNVADVDATVQITLPSGPGSTFSTFQGLAVRANGGSAYRSRMILSSSGKVLLDAERTGSSATSLGIVAVPVTIQAGVPTTLDLRVTGTDPVTIQARAYPTGDGAPAWQLSVTDSSAQRLQSAGKVGYWAYTAYTSRAVEADLDMFQAFQLRESGTTATATPTPSATATPTPTATTPAASAPVVTSSGFGVGRGAPTVGFTSYAVPSGAVVVSTSGSDSNPGTLASPKRTIKAAVTASSSGGTIVVRGGTYHEEVQIPSSKKLTLQSYPKEAVWLDGSVVVSTWRASGSVWVADGWTKEFDSSASFSKGQTYAGMILPAYPAAAHPDQLFVDGVAQTQVLSAAEVKPGTFYVDYAANQIVMGSNPAGHTVSATDLQTAVDILAPGSTVQGIGVRRYGSPVWNIGAIRAWAANITLRDVMVQDVATVGISVIKSGATIDHVTVQRAGQLGIHGNHADDLTVTNVVLKDNNTEHFNGAPAAGGLKLGGSRDIVIDNVLAQGNLSAGIWCDESCWNVTITNSEALKNTGSGIELEISQNAIVANNRSIGNEKGILILDTGNVQIYNNELGGNTLMGIQLWQDQRRQATWPTGRDSRQPVPDPTMPWITQDIVVSNNVFGNGGMFQIYALDVKTNRPVDLWNVTITGNFFNPRPDRSLPTMVAWGGSDNQTLSRYETPAALAAAKNSGWRNTQAAANADVTTNAALAKAQSSIAVPLPSAVAAAVGVPTGTTSIGVNP